MRNKVDFEEEEEKQRMGKKEGGGEGSEVECIYKRLTMRLRDCVFEGEKLMRWGRENLARKHWIIGLLVSNRRDGSCNRGGKNIPIYRMMKL